MRRVTLVYAAAVAAWSLLRLTPLTDWPPFALADLGGWVLYLPWPVFVLVAVIRLRWDALAALLLPITAFALDYGPQFAPQSVPQGDAVRLVTANVYFRNPDIGDAGTKLSQIGAGVLAVQELVPEMSRQLAERLRPTLPHQILYPSTGTTGLGVFSRFPIREVSPPETSAGSCRCQVVEIGRGKERFTMINVHVVVPGDDLRSFDPGRQESNVTALLRAVGSVTGRLIVLGDLNIGDRHHLFRRIRERLGDAYRDAGWGLGLTWGPKRNLVRIDYVLHDDQWETRSARTGTLPGSDHRYVSADLVAR